MQTVRPVPATRRRGASRPAGKVRAGAAVLGAGALVLLGAAAPAVAADGTWYVDQANGADGPECGVEPGASACATIGVALDHAAADDTVVIGPGTYFEALAIDSSITLEGTEDAVLVSDGSASALSAQGEGVEVSVTGLTIAPDPAGGSYAVVADAGSTVELSQVSIEHVPGATELGPAIRAQNFGSVVLTDSTVDAASSIPDGADSLRGGVDAINGGDLTITRTTISPAGGALFAGVTLGQFATDPGAPSTLTMTESVVSAGGIANVAILQGSATITDTSIPAPESASPAGGYGIVVGDGSLDLLRGEITGHPTAGIGNFGAGIGPSGTTDVTVDGTRIAENGTEGESQSGGIVMLVGSAESDGPTGSLDVTNASLIDNSTGIVTDGVPTTVTTSTISGSSRGIVAQDADVSVTDSELVGGSADSQSLDSGVRSVNRGEQPVALTITDSEISNFPVGVDAAGVTTEVSTSTIAGNSTAGIIAQRSQAVGGSSAGDTTVTDTEITGNGTPGLGPFSAGIIASAGLLTATGVTIADNANGMIVGAGSVTLADSSVTGSGAGAPEEGVIAGFGIVTLGGLDNSDAEFTITGSEISGNRAGMGLGRSTVVRNSTIANNTWYGISAQAPTSGTTIYVALSSSTMVGNGTEPMPEGDAPPFGLGVGPGAEVLVAGSILAASSAGAACYNYDSAGTLTDGGYNVVSDASCALTEESSLADTDPLLGVLGDNGGTTQTVLPALDSPAVDLIPVGSTAAGSDLELCLEGSTDQRGAGFPRPVGQACDAGAVETAFEPAQITTESLPDAIVGQSYTALLEATGGEGEPYAWVVFQGDLPDGLELNEETGEITGEPTEAGTFPFIVEVDGAASAVLSVTVLPELVIVTDALPEGTVGEPYSATLEATGGDGGPYTWGIDSGALPDGLELNEETGELIGEPTEAGTFEFTIEVDGVTSAEFSVTVLPELVIVTDALPGGIVGQSYTAVVEAAGGDGEPYAWAVSAGALPDGLELDAETGEITGEPTQEGTFEFTVEVDGAASADLSVTVLPELVIVTDALPEGTVGEPYSATLEATGGDGGPYTWGIDSGDLPDGLELNPETGVITGTPTAAENYTFTVVVGDPVYKEFTIEVVPAEPEQTPPPEGTDPPEEADPPEQTPPPADTPDGPAEETPAPSDGAQPEDGGLAVSGIGAPWSGLAFAGLAVLMGGVLLVLRKARRLSLDG